jgi:hypothetical protein
VRRVLLLAASILGTFPVNAAAEWLTLRTEHHQVAGNVSARNLKDVGLRLEQFREVIETLNRPSIRAIENTPVVVLAFPDERSYRPFLPMTNGRVVPNAGLFVSGTAGTYITLNLDQSDGGYRAVYHEFSHFLLRGAFAAAPLWFSEGLAEYYSTFEVGRDGRRAIIGKPIEDHVALLRQRRLPLATLLSISAASREYREETPDRHVLYAQSWALLHHALHSTPQRRGAVVDLAFRLAAGARPEQAVQDAYGITLAELERELQAYTRRESYSATGFEFKTAVVTALPAETMAADHLDVEAWLGGVQAGIGRHEEAAVRLENVLKLRPEHGRANAAMAEVRMRQGRTSEVQAHLVAAVNAGVLPKSTFQVVRRVTTPETPPPPRASDVTETKREPAPPPRNGGLILNLRHVGSGETRTLGTLQAIECRREGVVIVLATPQGATRAQAATLAAINLMTFRSTVAGSITCGPQTAVPALLTSRADGARTIAVALELLPDGYVP